MSIHVLMWYPVLCFFSMIQGKPVSNEEFTGNTGLGTELALSDETITICDTKCSSQAKNAGPCLIRILSYENGKAIIKQPLKANRDFEVPNPPSRISLKSPDDSKILNITITSGRASFVGLRYFLVELESFAESLTTGPYTNRQYFLLENKSRDKGYVPYSFKCGEIHHDVYEIKMTVWALGSNTGTDTKYLFKLYDGYKPIIARTYTSDNYRKNRMYVKACVCTSRVQPMRLYKDKLDPTTVHGYVNVTGFPRDGQLEILLLHNNSTGTREVDSWSEKGNGNNTVVKFKRGNLGPGNYYIKVKRHCENSMKILPECGYETPADIISKGLEIYPSDLGLSSDSSVNKSAGPEAPVSFTPRQRRVPNIVEIAIIVSSAFSLAMVLGGIIIRIGTTRKQHQLQGHRDSQERLLVPSSASSQGLSTKQEQPTTNKNLKVDGVPIIYTEDNVKHKENVYSLKEQLTKLGVSVIPIDFETCPEIRSNWIDFIEQLARTYKSFLFIMSPLLYKICEKGKYKDENRFNSLIPKTNGQHIPYVLLHNINVIHVKKGHLPRICLVELKDGQFRTDSILTAHKNTSSISNIMAEGTLSYKLKEDHSILYDAKCYTIQAHELRADLSSKCKGIQSLCRQLKA